MPEVNNPDKNPHVLPKESKIGSGLLAKTALTWGMSGDPRGQEAAKLLQEADRLGKEAGLPEILPSKEYDFRGKVVVVTGAASGIGKETVRCFALAGARVIAIDINPELTKKLTQMNTEDGITTPIEGIIADVGKQEEWSPLIEKLEKVDILCNVAAIIDPPIDPKNSESQPNIDDAMELICTPEGRDKLAKDATRVFESNFLGPYLLSLAVANKMKGDSMRSSPDNIKAKNERRGVIINIGSTNVFTLHDKRLVYAPLKAALHTWTQLMAKGLASYGIRVNCVAPGATADTAVVRDVAEAQKRMPLSINEVKDVVDAIFFFCSKDARNITGQIVSVDGGRVVSV